MTWRVKVSRAATKDREDIFLKGLSEYSLGMAEDYDRLIIQAFRELGADSLRHGARKVKGRDDGLLKYALENSKEAAGVDIKKPNKAVFYYILEDSVVAISRIMRERAEFEIAGIDREKTITSAERGGSDGDDEEFSP